MSENPLVPKVEIVENGIPVSQERVDPNVAAFIVQSVQAAQLVKLRKLEESKIPTGEISLSRTITDTIKEITLSRPWLSFTLANDGAGDVLLRINTLDGSDEGAAIGSGENYNFSSDYPIVKKLFLVTTARTTANVRIRALEGRPIG